MSSMAAFPSLEQQYRAFQRAGLPVMPTVPFRESLSISSPG